MTTETFPDCIYCGRPTVETMAGGKPCCYACRKATRGTPITSEELGRRRKYPALSGISEGMDIAATVGGGR